MDIISSKAKEMEKKMKKKYYGILITILTLIMLALCFNNNVWGDEAYTMNLIEDTNVIGIVQFMIAYDVHPPLYHLLTYLFASIFGASVFSLKILNVLSIVLTMVLGATLVDKYWGKDSVLLPSIFIVSLVGAPNLLHISLELRMYALALFFVTACGLFGYSIVVEGISKRRVAIFVFFSLCAAYTHYFALLSVAVIYLYLFIALIYQNKHNIKTCIIISGITIICYCPWLSVLLMQTESVSNDFWISSITIKDIITYVVTPFYYPTAGNIGKALIILYIIVGIVVVVTTIRQFKNLCDKTDFIKGILFASVYFVTILIGLLLSIVIGPIITAKYLYPCLGLLWLGILIIIVQVTTKKRIYLWSILGLFLISGLIGWNSEYSAAYDTGAQLTVNIVEENSENTDKLGSDISHLTWTVLKYYFKDYEIVQMDELFLEELATGEVIIYFSSTEELPFDDITMQKYEIISESLGVNNIDHYEFYLYKLYKE